MRYWLGFYGRKRGALGICHPCETVVEAESETEARTKAYDTHEHITGGVDGVDVARIYWTVRIGWQEYGRTEWHPTEKEGPFSVLSRGVFETRDHACEWASTHLGPGNWEAVEVTP